MELEGSLPEFTSARHLSLSWASSIQSIPPSDFLKVHLNIILPSTPGSCMWSLSLRFTHQNPAYTSPLPHTRYVPRPSHTSWFNRTNIIGWAVQIIQLLYMDIRNIKWMNEWMNGVRSIKGPQYICIRNNETLFKLCKTMAVPALLFGGESWALVGRMRGESKLSGQWHDIATFYGD